MAIVKIGSECSALSLCERPSAQRAARNKSDPVLQANLMKRMISDTVKNNNSIGFQISLHAYATFFTCILQFLRQLLGTFLMSPYLTEG